MKKKLQGDRCGGGGWTAQERLVGSIPTSQDDAPNCWAYFHERITGDLDTPLALPQVSIGVNV